MHSMIRRTTLGIAALLVATTAACGSRRNTTIAAPAAIEFYNEGLDVADVYASATGITAVRLGSVLSQRTAALEVPSVIMNQGNTVTITAVVRAKGTTADTGPITINSRGTTRLTLSGDGRSLRKSVP